MREQEEMGMKTDKSFVQRLWVPAFAGTTIHDATYLCPWDRKGSRYGNDHY